MRRFAIGLVLCAGACGPAFHYAPEVRASGPVRLGPVDVTRVTASGGAARALRVEMTVINDADEPWTLDTREQRALLVGERRAELLSPIAPREPRVTIPAHGARSVELRFLLPRALAKESRIPALEIAWRVKTPARELAASVRFLREPPLVTSWNQIWFGPTQNPDWWYDPTYPRKTYLWSPLR